MANVLVTGGAGFVGSHVATELIIRGHRVTILDDLSAGFRDNVPDDASFVQGSINDVDLVDDLFERRRFDYVYHFAAYAAEALSHFVKRFNYMNNVIGSVNLINASINTGTRCFVFASSIAVYGGNGQLPLTEEMSTQPSDPYGIAKLAVEQELSACKDMFDLDYTIFRLHNVYGERQNIGDKYRNVVGIFMNQIMQGKPMTIFGDGTQTRAFSHVGDVAPIMARAIEVSDARSQVFNVGAERPHSVKDLAFATARAMAVDPQVVYLPARKEVLHTYSSHKKIQQVFGRQEMCSLEEGLARMARWVKEYGPRTNCGCLDLEVTRNLPQVWGTPGALGSHSSVNGPG
jgi:UDP-glucose 4-epimerase